MATRKPVSRIRNKSKKSNGGLPTRVITIESGEYECNIVEITQQETKYGKAVVIKLEGQVHTSKVNLCKFYNINEGILSGSEFYIFLESMGAIKNGNITWSKIRGASVIALIEVNDCSKIKVKKLMPVNNDSHEESLEDEDAYEDDETEDEDYYDYGDEEDEE